jgi:predicted cobalt transporter CbtA
MTASLKRGLIAGLIAGLFAALFAFVVAEPVIDRAIAIEEQASHETAAPVVATETAAAAEAGHVHATEVSRDTQRRVGAPLGFALVGAAFGVFFALLYAGLGRFVATRDTWQRTLALAASALTAIVVVPFVRYPANPPGVGDPDTVNQRTRLYLAAVLLGIVAVTMAWRLLRELTRRGVPQPARHIVVAVAFVALIAAGYAVLPDNTDAVPVPATLLWDFRLRSIATQLILWAALAAGFGLLTERASRTRR